MNNKSQEKKLLEFHYCECGCKGFEAYNKELEASYWIFMDLKQEKAINSDDYVYRENGFYLRRGHGWLGRPIGDRFESFGEAKRAALIDLLNDECKKD